MLEKLRNKREDIFALSLLMVLCTIPLNFAYMSISTILFAIVNLLAVPKFSLTNLNKVYIQLILFYGLFLLSLSWSAFPDLTMADLSKKLSFLIIPLVLLFAPKIDLIKFYKIWKWFGRYLALLFITLLVLATIKYLETQDFSVYTYHALTSPLDMNAIYMSYLVSVSLLININQTKKSSLNFIFIMILLVFLILLSSKLIIVITLCAAFGLVIKNNIFNYKKLLIALCFVIGLILISPIKNRFITEFNSNYKEVLTSQEIGPTYNWKGAEIRVFMVRIATEILNKENSWLGGTGLGASQPFIEENMKEKKLYYDYWSYNFHNQYIQILVELGIVGILFYSGLLITMAYDFRKIPIALSIIAVIIFWGITESFLWRQRGMLFFLITIALLYQTKFNRSKF